MERLEISRMLPDVEAKSTEIDFGLLPSAKPTVWLNPIDEHFGAVINSYHNLVFTPLKKARL
jgi:hypothetical protein